MGEITEMMLDGYLCQHCGIVLEEAYGYPQSCGFCKEQIDEEEDA